MVYADVLGDDRGEHIVLAHLDAPTREQQARERALRRATEERLIALVKAPDGGRRNLARLSWKRGFIDRIDVDLRGDDAPDRLATLLAQPELVRLRAIDLRQGWHARPDCCDFGWLAAVLAPTRVRWLGIGALGQSLDLEPIRALKLSGLALTGSNLDAAALRSLDASDLELTVSDFSEALVDAIGARDRIVLHGEVDRSILERFDKLPARFGIMGGNDAFNDAFAEWLVTSGRIATMTSVGFTVQRNTGSNRWLVEHKDAFAHVTFFTMPQWDGGWPHAWHDLAHLYEALGRTQEALAEFEALVTFDDDAAYWADIGFQLTALERRAEALAAHDRALELDEKNHRALSGRACILEDQERFADAIVAWDRGIAAGLDDIHTLTHRAWTLMRLDRNGEALAALDAVLAKDPEHEWSLKEKKRLARSPRGLVSRARKWLGA